MVGFGDSPSGTCMRALLSLLAVGACDGGHLGPDNDVEEIEANLEAAGVRDDDIELVSTPEGPVVVVGGDAVVGVEASRSLAPGVASEEGSFRHFVGVHASKWNLVDVDYETLNASGEPTVICVARGSIAGLAPWAAWRVGLDNAAARWNALGLGIAFAPANSCSSGHAQVIEIDASSALPAGKVALANVPSAGTVGSTIRLDPDLVPGLDTHGSTTLMMHMLGHAVGLHHTDWSGWASDTDESESGYFPARIPFTIPFSDPAASKSIMATQHLGNGKEWTDSDEQALRVLYSPDFCATYDGTKIALDVAETTKRLTGRGQDQNIEALQPTSSVAAAQKLEVDCSPGDGSFSLSQVVHGTKLYVARDMSSIEYHAILMKAASSPSRWRATRLTVAGYPRWKIELDGQGLGLFVHGHAVELDENPTELWISDPG